mmetsp:Transcript_7246/g.26271  ORF Transcript_7246/g.26271 Transcript_7246/m.26271 type:complete len:202 (-) Transcript_7246:751-1356(-)
MERRGREEAPRQALRPAGKGRRPRQGLQAEALQRPVHLMALRYFFLTSIHTTPSLLGLRVAELQHCVHLLGRGLRQLHLCLRKELLVLSGLVLGLQYLLQQPCPVADQGHDLAVPRRAPQDLLDLVRVHAAQLFVRAPALADQLRPPAVLAMEELPKPLQSVHLAVGLLQLRLEVPHDQLGILQLVPQALLLLHGVRDDLL